MNTSRKEYIQAASDVRLLKLEKCHTTTHLSNRTTSYSIAESQPSAKTAGKDLIAFDGTIGNINQGAKIIHAHIRDIRKFRSHENEEHKWEAKLK